MVHLNQISLSLFPDQIPVFGHANGKELYAEKPALVYCSFLASGTEHSTAPGDLKHRSDKHCLLIVECVCVNSP